MLGDEIRCNHTKCIVKTTEGRMREGKNTKEQK